jgi:hypothetical protein
MLTPPIPLHLSGPLHQPRNLLFRWRRGDPALHGSGSVVYLWRKVSTKVDQQTLLIGAFPGLALA